MDQNIMNLLEDRYFLDGETKWEDIARRVAKVVAAEESEEDQLYFEELFFDKLNNMEFIPNSPCLMNANTSEQYMSACNVLPVDDSMDDIFEAIKQLALVNKAGSGTGFAFSRLRPKGSKVGDIDGVSSGPISFMRVFDRATDIVKQGGRRKGANMGVLRVDHPDIEEFIESKGTLDDRHQEIFDMISPTLNDYETEVLRDVLLEQQLTNFNVSVGITDEFMKALQTGKEYELINPNTGKVEKTIFAQEIWDKITHFAHKNGEPGLVFLDTINKNHPIDEEIESVNVCGEQPLLPYESCTLGAINLSKMVRKNGVKYYIDWGKLKQTTQILTRFLDNIIDANQYPLQELEDKAKEYRKIGVGVMGFHEMLLKLDIPYNSEEGRKVAKQIAELVNDFAINESVSLAEEKGTFPEINNTNLDIPRRNSVLTTVAPTGSRAMIANTSYGIEPFFSFKYTHIDADGNERQMEYDFTEYASEESLTTALDMTPEDHLLMQAAWQKHVGSAVSKTINLPKEITEEEIGDIYEKAYDLGLKGITIYRNGSRHVQPLNDDTEKEQNDSQDSQEATEKDKQNGNINNSLERGDVLEAQSEAKSYRYKLKTGCGTMWLIIVVDDNDNIIETFTESANGGCMVFTRATSRLISTSLRGGIDLDIVIDQLLSAGSCPSYQAARGKGKDVSPGASCAGAIALKLKEVREKLNNGNHKSIKDMTEKRLKEVTTEPKKVDIKKKREKANADESAKCPECGSPIQQESGCVSCRNCGWSKCG